MGNDLALTWRGKTHTIPPRRQMETIRAIERHLTRRALMSLMLEPDPKLGELAEAQAAALRIAGAPATADEAYKALAANAADPDDFWSVPHVAVCCELLRIMLLPQQWQDFRTTLETTLARLAAGEPPELEPEEPARPLADATPATKPRRTKSRATVLN